MAFSPLAAAALGFAFAPRNARAEESTSASGKRPNVVVVQPDDLPFYDKWWYPDPPPRGAGYDYPSAGLPHIESLRTGGAQFTQAYTVGPMCGTSRFATLTSRHPSRAASMIEEEDVEEGEPSWVHIQSVKLEGRDCERDNLAVQFRDGGYRTAMIGKWHLSHLDASEYTYDGAVDIVKGCGFDRVGALYVENLWGDFNDGSFGHNMEWVTSEALKVIEEESDEPFFMYFNPTLLHNAGDFEDSLRDYSCRDTPAGTLDADPVVPGMTDDGDCASYRRTVVARAERDDDLGAIWLDDGVGALLRSLREAGKLDDTIVVFQSDHGVDPKASLYEGGIRIPLFVHYPAAIDAGTKFDAPVTVLDLGPTLLEYAGVAPSYESDGASWKAAVGRPSSAAAAGWDDRCLYFEHEWDRAVRCGCLKFLSIPWPSGSETHELGAEYDFSTDERNLFDLCDEARRYDFENWKEFTNLIDWETSVVAAEMETAIACHLKRIRDGDFSQCQMLSDPPGNDAVSVSAI
ncbi:hypothetical protein ACHAWF_003875 [Thalassiosira exigua]